MAFVVPSVYTAIDKVTPVTKKMTASVDTMAAKSTVAFNKVDRSIRSAGRSLQNTFGNFGLAIGATAIVSSVTNSLANYEQALVNVGKTANIEGDELVAFGQNAIKLSKSLGNAISSEKLLELGGVAGQLGVKGSQNILKFSETLARLELSTNVVGEEGAASIARIINIMGEKVGTVDRFGSTLVDLGNNSAASESEILSLATEVAKSTAPFDLGSKSLLGISAALTSLGAKPEAAGSAVGRFFKELEVATQTGKGLGDFAKLLGRTEQDIITTFKTDKVALFKSFAKGLEGVKNSGGSVAVELEKLGIRGEIAFKGLAPLAGGYDILSKSLDRSNAAYKANNALSEESDKSLVTLRARLNSIPNAFNNYLNSQANATGGTKLLSSALGFVSKNLGTLLNVLIVAAGVYAAIKTATIAYNTVLAIQGAITGSVAISVNSSRIAMAAYKVTLIAVQGVTKLWTAAQWALNVALNANPIGLIIIAIAALVGLVVLVINKWDEWGAALSIVLGPLGMIISLIQSFRRNWDSVIDAFTTGGIVAGLTRIGQVILDAILAPIQQALELANRFTGFGGEAAEAIRSFRETRLETIPPEQTTTTAAARDEVSVERSESISRDQQEINVNVRTDGNSTADVQTSGIPVSVDPTFAGI